MHHTRLFVVRGINDLTEVRKYFLLFNSLLNTQHYQLLFRYLKVFDVMFLEE